MPGERGGYLYQRGTTWWGRVRIDGREYRTTLRTGDRREATKKLKAWCDRLEHYAFGSPRHSWEEAVARFGEDVLPKSVKPSSAERYIVSLRQLTKEFRGQYIDGITGPAIADYVGRRTSTATNATIGRDITALSRLLAACVAWGWRQDNPARTFDRSLVREVRHPIQPPTADEFERFLAECTHGMAAVLRVLDQSGMREMEAVTLADHNIDWDARTVTLFRTKTNRPRVLAFSTPGGDLTPLLEPLRSMKGTLLRSGRRQPFGANFSSRIGRVMRELADSDPTFRRFRVHDLRHGFAIRWLRAGGDLYALNRHLGHSSVKTTEGYLGYVVKYSQGHK